MQKHTLIIHAHKQPELLERLLRTVRHRGFQLIECHMTPSSNKDNDGIQEIIFSVESERQIHLLVNQLAKLWDVLNVKLNTFA